MWVACAVCSSPRTNHWNYTRSPGLYIVELHSCLTLCDPMDCSLLVSSTHGIFQARILEWVAIFFSRKMSRSHTTSFKKCIIFCLFSFKKIKYKFINFNWRLITLQYCIGFATHQHESATGIHVFPILNPPPSLLSVPSLWVVSVYQPQASSIMIEPGLSICFIYDMMFHI